MDIVGADDCGEKAVRHLEVPFRVPKTSRTYLTLLSRLLCTLSRAAYVLEQVFVSKHDAFDVRRRFHHNMICLSRGHLCVAKAFRFCIQSLQPSFAYRSEGPNNQAAENITARTHNDDEDMLELEHMIGYERRFQD